MEVIIAVISDVDKICRTCLGEKEEVELQFLYDNQLVNKLGSLTGSVQPLLGDGLPNYLCNGCVEGLNNALDFRDRSIKSQEKLQQILLIESPPKVNITLKELLNTINETNVRNELEAKNILEIEHGYTQQLLPYKKKNNSETQELLNESFMIDGTTQCSKISNTTEQTTINNKYSCNKCMKVFHSKIGLRIHSVKHGKRLSCEVCGKTFNLVKQLNRHIKLHEGYKPYICKLCRKPFASSSYLSKHMRVHGGEKKHLCVTCGMRFFEPSYLVIHMRTHTGEKPIGCKICGKRFADPHSLIAHNKIHTGERNYECKTCGKRFAHSFVLRAHERVHTGEKPFSCSTCGLSYATSSYLTIHKRTHTQEKPFKCESCPKAFVSRCALVAHNMIHTGEKRFQCTVCGKRVARASDLNTHLRSHTGEKPYKCDQCSKQYHTSSNLSAHKRTHLGIKNHVCSICQKRFGDSRTLKGHIRIHTGEKPYICNICGNKYSQSGQLSTHRKVHSRPSESEPQYLPDFNSTLEQVTIQQNILEESAQIVHVFEVNHDNNFYSEIRVIPKQEELKLACYNNQIIN